MPTYKITSPSGKTISITGDQPPTEDQLNQIFQQTNTINSQPQQKGFLQSLLDPFSVAGEGIVDWGRLASAGANKLTGGAVGSPITGQEQPVFISPQEQQNIADHPISSTAKEAAGLASWAVPEAKLLKGAGLLAKTGNMALTGAAQGGLNAASQQGADPNSIATGALKGAITNPALSGAGKILTDALPRYIGFRNFGPSGLKLPEVVKAEMESKASGTSLADKSYMMQNAAKPINRDEIIKMARSKAGQESYIGTPGLEEAGRRVGHVGVTRSGLLPEIERQINLASTPSDLYARVRNLAYPKDNSPAATKLASFARDFAHDLREYVIKNSNNPSGTRKAMDTFASQTKIGKEERKTLKESGLDVAKVEGPNLLASLLPLVPSLSQLGGITTPLALADLVISNQLTGPALAKGLVKGGNLAEAPLNNISNLPANFSLGDVLKKLGIQGILNATQGGPP